MGQIKAVYKFLDAFFFAVCGLTWIDLLAINAFSLDSIDNVIKTLMALAGFVYFALTIPHKFKMWKLDRKIKDTEQRIKEQELIKLEKANNKND